jgi:nucleoid DNA-binding protein
MTRETLYKVLEEKGLTSVTAKRVVDEFFQALLESIASGDETGIKNFVRFRTRLKPASTFMNNRMKKRMPVPDHRVVLARFAKSFREMFVTGAKPEGERP